MKKNIIHTSESRILHDLLVSALKKCGKVKVTGIGIFEIKITKKRIARNPKTGEVIVVPAHKKLTFRASKTLKKEVLK